VPAYTAHARAVAADDPHGLVAAADRFEAIGAVLLATEAATEAAHAHQRRGQTSRQVAERLHLSVRTVDNHLQNAYTKLGVGGRDQLAAALAQATADTPVSPPVPRRPRRPSSPPQ
jgi:DNA-directed RNA polymerase specialized sigma24 family protein